MIRSDFIAYLSVFLNIVSFHNFHNYGWILYKLGTVYTNMTCCLCRSNVKVKGHIFDFLIRRCWRWDYQYLSEETATLKIEKGCEISDGWNKRLWHG